MVQEAAGRTRRGEFRAAHGLENTRGSSSVCKRWLLLQLLMEMDGAVTTRARRVRGQKDRRVECEAKSKSEFARRYRHIMCVLVFLEEATARLTSIA